MNRSCGYHRAMVTSVPISPAAQPAPMRARATASPPAPSAVANTAEPAAASANSPDIVRRGPKRSSSIPVGICMMPKAKKNAPVITPIVCAEMESVRMSSGAMTAFDTRKNWLAMKPAQSTASMGAGGTWTFTAGPRQAHPSMYSRNVSWSDLGRVTPSAGVRSRAR